MADLFDYLQWRGDILFSQLSVNPVDALIFSALTYVQYENIVPETTGNWISLQDAATAVLSLPDPQGLVRVEQDLKLLKAALILLIPLQQAGRISHQVLHGVSVTSVCPTSS